MSSDIIEFNQNALPKVPAGEQTLRDASTIIERWQRAHIEAGGRGQSHYQHLIATIDELTPAVDKLCTQLAKLNEPATKRDIANHLGFMLKSFPNAGKDNAEIFGRALAQDVASQQPTVGALEAACRHLRRTNRFIPTIAEVLTALAEAEASQRQTIRTLASLPEQKSKLLARVADDKAREAEWERREPRPKTEQPKAAAFRPWRTSHDDPNSPL